jgi:hypothetical protein
VARTWMAEVAQSGGAHALHPQGLRRNEGDRGVGINRRLLPSALTGIDRRLLLGSIVGSCWDRPSAFAGIDRRLNHL